MEWVLLLLALNFLLDFAREILEKSLDQPGRMGYMSILSCSIMLLLVKLSSSMEFRSELSDRGGANGSPIEIWRHLDERYQVINGS